MSQELQLDPQDVFICYERENKVLVREVCEALKAQGVSVAWDEDIPGGADWAEWADTAIHDCKVVLLMCTASSLQSQNVKNEVAQSLDWDKKLIPLHLEKNLAYPAGLRMRISRWNKIEMDGRLATEWLPELLRALDTYGVAFRKQATPPEGLISETTSWVEKLRAVASRIQKSDLQETALDSELVAIRQAAIDARDSLEAIDRKRLTSLYQTFVALARRERVDDKEAAALRQLQGTLVDIARVMIHMRVDKLGELDDLPLPPYDLWLPFKSGPVKRLAPATV